MMKKELDNLELVLTSPRKRAPGTISSYMSTAHIFLTWKGDDKVPTDMDLRRFFMEREKAGIAPTTRGANFIQLKKLFEANNWPWPFKKEDKPVAEEETSVPAFTPDEMEVLIKNMPKYTKQERFYVAVSTVYGLRREELGRIGPRDVKENIISLQIAKQKKMVRRQHLIPEEILPVVSAWKPRIRTARALSFTFHRIMVKAGLGERPGWGFHCIRRTVFTLLMFELAKHSYPPQAAAEYIGWAKKTIGMAFMGSAMAGVYAHPEIMAADPYQLDRTIFSVHPFLPLFKEVQYNAGDMDNDDAHEGG